MELSQAGWRPEVRDALCTLAQRGSNDGAPVVFDFDNTCIAGDVGELFGHFLVETMRYRYDLDSFWELIHPADGRQRLRELTQRALAVDEVLRSSSEAYERYLSEMAALYGRRLHRAGKRDCYAWAVRLHLGLTPAQMDSWSMEAIVKELTQPRRCDVYCTDAGEEVEVQRGIRPLREIRELMLALEQAGFEVWIVSATNVWSVRQFAPYFGVPPRRVLGNRVEVRGDQLTDQTIEPALFREGKAEVIDDVIGRTPVLAVGDAITDYEMLCMASDLALVIDRGDETLRRGAEQRGWLLQPQQELTHETPDSEAFHKKKERKA